MHLVLLALALVVACARAQCVWVDPATNHTWNLAPANQKVDYVTPINTSAFLGLLPPPSTRSLPSTPPRALSMFATD